MGSKNRTNYFSPFKKKIDSWRLSHSCHSEVMFIPNLFGDLRLGKALDLYITGVNMIKWNKTMLAELPTGHPLYFKFFPLLY